MNYLRNTWHMAAWADEVVAEAPLARTILEERACAPIRSKSGIGLSGFGWARRMPPIQRSFRT